MDVSGFSVQLQQLQRNVDALMNQSASVTARNVGARQIMTVLAVTNTGVINQSIVGPATGTLVTGSTTTFQVGYRSNVMTFYRYVCVSTGSFSYADAIMDGTSDANNTVFINSLTYQNAVVVRLDMLDAGSHTASITMDVDTGQTGTMWKAQIKVFQLGN